MRFDEPRNSCWACAAGASPSGVRDPWYGQDPVEMLSPLKTSPGLPRPHNRVASGDSIQLICCSNKDSNHRSAWSECAERRMTSQWAVALPWCSMCEWRKQAVRLAGLEIFETALHLHMSVLLYKLK